jgi:hypothetical protein
MCRLEIVTDQEHISHKYSQVLCYVAHDHVICIGHIREVILQRTTWILCSVHDPHLLTQEQQGWEEERIQQQ